MWARFFGTTEWFDFGSLRGRRLSTGGLLAEPPSPPAPLGGHLHALVFHPYEMR